MKYHAHIEYKNDWWIGWLTDLPGVNAQEYEKQEVLSALKKGAEDMLDYLGKPDNSVTIVEKKEGTNGSS